MIIAGSTSSPVEFFQKASRTKMRFSVNDVQSPNIIITGFENFIKLKPTITNQRCLIFDTQERLESIQGLVIIKDKKVDMILDRFKSLKHVEITGVVNKNYIFEFLEKNKEDGGFLDLFSTNLYKVSQKPVREAVRTLFLSLLTSKINPSIFKRDILKIMPKKGKAQTAVEFLLELSGTDLFRNMQECIKKAKNAKNDREIKQLAQQYDVAAYDVRYLLSTLKSS